MSSHNDSLHIMNAGNLRPLADNQVTGTISRLTPQQATITIQISNNRPVPESNEDFSGVIRLADIRLTERDKIKMGDCFRLGDLVRAKVVSGVFSSCLFSHLIHRSRRGDRLLHLYGVSRVMFGMLDHCVPARIQLPLSPTIPFNMTYPSSDSPFGLWHERSLTLASYH